MVEEFDYSIYGAAKDLKIRPSTAKAIMKRYRETGTVLIKEKQAYPSKYFIKFRE